MRWLLLSVVLLLPACRRSPDLPVLYAVPPFKLTSERGQEFSSESLKGQVWLADFIFTNCPGPCLRMSAQMKKFETQVRLVSFTVDPKRDTPAVLAAYARRYQADPTRWTFLTGPADKLNHLSRNVFKVGDIEADLTHSTRLVLVDRQMRIRGFFDSGDAEDLLKLKAAIETL